jgi:uncharacterized membrane protein YecN with MAPEG domain
MLITPIYAALFGLLLVALSFRVIRLRQALSIGIGDGNNKQLQRAIRVHGNFAEYVPLTLLLIFFMEQQTGYKTLTHGFCTAFLIARLAHAYGVSQIREDLRIRVFGVSTTGCVIVISALVIIADGVSA